MAFVIKSVNKCSKFTSVLVRQNSGGSLASGMTKATVSSSSTDLPPPKELSKSVFISQSRDVFTNLALEDWMYKNMDFTDNHIMLLWRNDPCVVVGRNQNPWSEANVDFLERQGIKIARRNSGGGCVYHDPGNLNVTFFCPMSRYNRKQNLEILANTLKKNWGLSPEINKKEDLIINDKYKISGTASRLGRDNSYHHCTLLVNVDKSNLKTSLLKNSGLKIKSTATPSVPSPTINLSELNPTITVEALVAAIGWQYMMTDDLTNEDKSWPQVQKQKGFQMVNPSDEWFPGIQKIRNELSSWDWNFAKSPKFEINQDYDIGWGQAQVSMKVENGLVKEVHLVLPDGVSWGDATGRVPLSTAVENKPFNLNSFKIVQRALSMQKFQWVESNQRRHAAASG